MALASRDCRNCGKRFQPQKVTFWWCSLACRNAEKGTGSTKSTTPGVGTYDQGRDDGFRAGHALGLMEGRAHGRIPPEVWRSLLHVAHPDRHHGSALEPFANAATVWLLNHKPEELRS